MHAPDERRPRASAAHLRHMKMSAAHLRHTKMFEVVTRDPDFRLDTFLCAFADTANPYYMWQALDVCLKHKREIPGWLTAYLAECIDRMESDRAKKASDLARVLPWVFGFSKKSGPGNLLDPDRDPDRSDKLSFALHFAIKIEQGERPSAALMSPCDEVLDQERAEKITEKTLKSWLIKHFRLKKWPRTNSEWNEIAREHFCPVVTFIEERHRQIRKRSREIAT
jgi:hypothetical protein